MLDVTYGGLDTLHFTPLLAHLYYFLYFILLFAFPLVAFVVCFYVLQKASRVIEEHLKNTYKCIKPFLCMSPANSRMLM